MTKLTRSQSAQLAALTRWHRMSPDERSLATAPARDAWMETYGKPKLVRMAHQRHGRLTKENAPRDGEALSQTNEGVRDEG